MARKPLPARNRFNADGSVNPRSAPPSRLTPYVGPSGANRPVGWGGHKWLQDNAKALNDPATVHKRFPEQFGADGKVRQDYVPTPRGQQQKTGNVPKSAPDRRVDDGRPGPDGISPAARRVGADVGAQKDAWESTLRGNPDLAAQLQREGNHAFKPQDAAAIQRSFDAIHVGSGGNSDGMGSVYRLSGQQAQQFNQANHQYSQDHMQSHSPAEQPAGDGKQVGWSNKARAASAAARGAKWTGPTE